MNDNTDKNQRYARHELLGSRVFESNDTEYSWQNLLDIREVSWLSEHVVLDQIVFPAAGYIAMAGESMRQLSNGSLESYSMENLFITSALLLRSDEKVRVRTRLRPVAMTGDTNQWFEIRITSYERSQWVERCVGKVFPLYGPNLNDLDAPHPQKPLERHVGRAYWYDLLESCGLKYGPAFRGLDEISTAVMEHKSVASISSFEDTTSYILHPVTLDQCLQLVLVAASKGQGRSLTRLSVVIAIEKILVSKGGRTKFRIGGMSTKSSSGNLTGNVSAVSEEGRSILLVKSCEASLVPNERQKCEDKIFSFVKWDTDVTHCNLNQAIVSSLPQPDPSRFLDVIKILAHKNPKLKILELGSGADKITPLIINALKSQSGELLYSTYTYAATTLDAAFRAKMTLRGTSNLNVVFFDTEQQSQSPTLQAGAYDLIITTDV